jgi:hypothetical protein
MLVMMLMLAQTSSLITLTYNWTKAARRNPRVLSA